MRKNGRSLEFDRPTAIPAATGSLRRWPGRLIFEAPRFVIAVKPGARQEAHALRAFERKHTSASGHDIDDQMRVLPVFELRSPDVERMTADLTQQDVLRPDHKIATWIAHRGAAIAAAPRLMKHQRPMPALEPLHECQRFRRRADAFDLILDRVHR